MPQSVNNYDLLIAKLDRFIRKYYVNQLIRGALYTVGLVLLLFLTVSLLESQFYFSTGTRKALWFGFLGLSLVAVGGWVLLPLTRYFRLGPVIGHERAALIIGRHFGNVQDKLLNVLQLRRQAGAGGNNALLLASIDQKSAEISPVPFRSAIDLRQNRRYLKYALPPLLLLLVILFAAPSLIRDSTSRLIRNSETFERPAPFSFVVADADALEVVQYADYALTVRVDGDLLPAEAYIEVDGYRYRLNRQAANTFTYQFSNVQEDTPFKLSTAEVESADYTLRVLPKPNIAGFTVDLDYPAYLGRRDEQLANVGDLTVPAGTRIKWSFDTENTDRIDLRFAGDATTAPIDRDGSNLYSFDRRAMRSDRYTLYVGNDRLPVADSVAYSLAVVPDLYPQISVESFRDSTDEKLLFFVGEASDDHGLTKLNLVYRIQRAGGGEEAETRLAIGSPSGKQIRYDHVWDLATEVDLEAGDELTYYFEVYDNDGVRGAKSARTGLMSFKLPTRQELAQRADANDSKIKEELKKALDATRDLQEDTKKLREKMLQEKEVDWKLKKEAEKLAERQREVQEQIQEAQRAFEENLENETPQNEQINDKQQKLQEMFEKSLSEEMQQLMQDIQDLMEQLNKDEALEKIQDMELSDEETEAELDRMLELFKQLEVEKDMQDAIEQLEELAEKQEELARETEQQEGEQPDGEEQDAEEQDGEEQEGDEEGDAAEENPDGEETSGEKPGEEEKSEEKTDQSPPTPEKLQREQEELTKEFEELRKQLDEAERKNEELDKPMQLDTQEEAQEAIQQDMQDAQQKMEQQDNQGAAKKQKEAGQKMKKMAEQMSQSMQSMQMEGAKEDMAAIRQLLENIVDLSFDQEATMDEFNVTTVNTPRYVELVQRQFQINNDFELVRDSLQALAKRNFQIETFITEKVTEIKGDLTQTVSELEERHTPQAANYQQRAMTGLNDLALMLSESMEQMQQQMAGMMQGDQQCQNPGSGEGKEGQKPSSNPGSEGQGKLGEAMRQMKEGLEKGEGGSSKEFAEMAARQAALRRALEEKQRQQQQGGEGKDAQLQELIDQMNAAEEDLVNKRLTNESLMRQQEILTRMLEHEKAEREQKMDEQRKSETAEQRRRELPPSLEEYIRQRRAEIEMFKRVTPELKPYYQGLVDEYFRSLRGK